jgi:UDP-N-acetylglucosamine/UDP-N-acetylgalactosamine diphosphorylase
MLVMTSKINHNETVAFFEAFNFFGGNRDSFVFFPQSVLPAVDFDGKIFLETAGKIVMAPNGNGALFEAVLKNEEVQMILKSIDYVQVIGVDNVLNKVLDPVFFGYAETNNY